MSSVQDQINYRNADHANTLGQLQPGPERSSPAIYPPFMGMVNGMHPLRVLDEPDQRQAP